MGTVKYTGPVASFHCPTEATIRSLKVHFSPKQLGSGTPSPENVREIVGWDGVEVEQRGKNLFNANAEFFQGGDKRYYSKIIPNDVLCNVSFKLKNSSIDLSKVYFGFALDSSNIELGYNWVMRSGNIQSNKTNKAPGNKLCTYMTFYPNTMETFESLTQAYDIQIELGAETPYEPYSGSTTNYEFGVLGKNKVPFLVDSKTISSQTNGNAGWCNVWKIPNKNLKYTYSAYIDNTNNTNTANITVWLKNIDNTSYVDGIAKSGTQVAAGEVGRSIITLDASTLSNTYYFVFGITSFIKSGETASCTFSNPMVEIGDTATTYEPYDPNHTVYGGWVDLISGEVCEEWGGIYIDGTQNTYISGGAYRGNNYTDAWFDAGNKAWGYTASYAGILNNSLCDTFNLRNYAIWGAPDSYPWSYVLNSYNQIHCVFNNELLDITSEVSNSDAITKIKAWVAENPFKVMYKLSNEKMTTYHLAPTQLQTFLGQNNVWSNADYVEVEYDLHETQNILARKQFIIASQPHIVKSAAAPLQNFVTDMAAPLKECKVYFSPVQEGEGDPSPDNIRPINGWNGLVVAANRAPLPKEYQEVEYIQTASAYSYIITDFYPNSETDYYIKASAQVNGTNEMNGYLFSSGGLFELYKKGGYYTFQYIKGNGIYTTGALTVNRYLEEHWVTGRMIKRVPVNGSAVNTTLSEYDTFQSVKPLILFGAEVDDIIQNRYGGGSNPMRIYRFTLYENSITVRDYIPCYRKSDNEVGLYDLINKTFLTHSGEGTFSAGPEVTTGSIIYTDWTAEAGTIYGGYLDLMKGEVVEEWHKIVADGVNVKANLDYNKDEWFGAGIVYLNPIGLSGRNSIFCDTLPINTIGETGYIYVTGNGRLYVVFYIGKTEDYPEITTKQQKIDFTNAWLQEHPTTLVYKLATPIVHTLTPTQLKTLRGTNNIWSNSNGDITVRFWTH